MTYTKIFSIFARYQV